MARYHKGLEYHDDVTEKHEITKEELEFLIELQHEMNTQDHVSQADPRFWVIKGSERVAVDVRDADTIVLVDQYSYDELAFGYDDIVKYLNKEVMPEISKNIGDCMFLSYNSSLGYFIINKEIDETGNLSELWKEIDELEDFFNENGFDNLTFGGIKKVSKIYPNTLALTQKAMEDHLRLNYYHYSEDAHTYAMTAWRNPEAEKLWKILQEVDFKKMLNKLSEPDSSDELMYELKIYSNWDSDMGRFIFNNLEKAQGFMREKWQEAMNSNEYDVQYHEQSIRFDTNIESEGTYVEDKYAVVTWCDSESGTRNCMELSIEEVVGMLE